MEYTKEQQIEILRNFVKDQVDRCTDPELLDLIWKILLSYKDESTLYPKDTTIKR